MNPTHRRSSLGLTIHGPYSRNRRRIQWLNHLPNAIAVAIGLGIITFLYHLFLCSLLTDH